MKLFKLLIGFGLVAFLFACSEENELEGIEPKNEYDVSEVDFISITKTEIFKYSCKILIMDVAIDSSKLPADLTYTHIKFLYDDRRLRLEEKPTNIYLEVDCNAPTNFQISLFDRNRLLESNPYYFTYTP